MSLKYRGVHYTYSQPKIETFELPKKVFFLRISYPFQEGRSPRPSIPPQLFTIVVIAISGSGQIPKTPGFSEKPGVSIQRARL